MNPFGLSATGLLVWGIVLHLIGDWPLQNDWLANNKMRRHVVVTAIGRTNLGATVAITNRGHWWLRHPAAYLHAGIHVVLLAIIFGWAAIPLGVIHLIIDTRTPIVWWSKLVGQTQPPEWPQHFKGYQRGDPYAQPSVSGPLPADMMYVGTAVRFWTDQTIHIACIALAAILVTL